MKRKLIIILSICLYTAIIAYIFDNAGTQILVRSGGTYQFSKRSYDGLQCRTEYLLDSIKTNPEISYPQGQFVTFDKKVSKECPSDTAKPKTITRQEFDTKINNALKDSNNAQIILTETE